MELLPGWGPPTWSPAPSTALNLESCEPRLSPGPVPVALALYFLLLGSPHCTEAMPPCKEEEYPVGSKCCPKCSPGYYLKQACGEFRDTLCARCTRGTYTAHVNGLRECLKCHVCDPALGLVTRRKCFSTKNAVCSCDQGHFCTMEDGDDCAACRPHSVCRPGQRVQERGTERQDTKCADCPPGTFSLNGSLAECQPWTKCRGLLQVETNPGTSSSDATCSFWRLWVLISVVLILVPVLLVICYLGMKARKSRGGRTLTRPKCLQLERQRAEGNAAAVQALPTSQLLPDVTTVAVEESASMSLNP